MLLFFVYRHKYLKSANPTDYRSRLLWYHRPLRDTMWYYHGITHNLTSKTMIFMTKIGKRKWTKICDKI